MDDQYDKLNLSVSEQFDLLIGIRELSKLDSMGAEDMMLEISKVMPRRRKAIQQMLKRTSKGIAFIDALAPLLTDQQETIIRAGTAAQNISKAADQCIQVLELRDRVWRLAKSLIEPALFLVSSIVVFLGINLIVMPSMIQDGDPTVFMEIAGSIWRVLTTPMWLMAIVATIGGTVYAANDNLWLKRIELIDDGVRKINLAVYLKLVDTLMSVRSVSLRDALTTAAQSVHPYYRMECIRFQKDALEMGVDIALDPRTLQADAERARWPIAVRQSLVSAMKSNWETDTLASTAESIFTMGEVQTSKVIKLISVVAKALFMSMLLVSISSYFFGVSAALKAI